LRQLDAIIQSAIFNLNRMLQERVQDLARSSTSNRQGAASLVFLASLRLCVRLLFESIDDTRNAVFD
jgi:hypothetical protein